MKENTKLMIPRVIKISEKEIKKNIKTNNKQSAEDIIIAVHYLSQVINGLRAELGRTPLRKEILYEMKRIGFEMSAETLLRYSGKIKKVRTAVRDLLEEGTYSAYFEHNMTLLDDIEEYSMQCYLKNWTDTKIVNKQALHRTGDIIDLVDKYTTKDIAAPKAAFLKILVSVAGLRMKALSGDNVNLSAAMLSGNFQTLKENYEELYRKHQITEKELRTVLKKKNRYAVSSD